MEIRECAERREQELSRYRIQKGAARSDRRAGVLATRPREGELRVEASRQSSSGRKQESVVARAAIPHLTVDLPVPRVESRTAARSAAHAIRDDTAAWPYQPVGSHRRNDAVRVGRAHRVVHAARSHVPGHHGQTVEHFPLGARIPLHDVVALRLKLDERGSQSAGQLHQ